MGDTFHLFPETMEFLKEIEEAYDFKAEVFCAEGVPVGDKDGYDAKYGADLWEEDLPNATLLPTGLLRMPLTTLPSTKFLTILFMPRDTHPTATLRIPSPFQKMDLPSLWTSSL